MPARPLPQPSLADPRMLGSVLVVEEHDGVRSALRDWLLTSFPPLRLREARSLEEALRLADQAQLDLILVNLELPGPNGIEATRALRKRHPDCPVVVMSVTDSEARRRGCTRPSSRFRPWEATSSLCASASTPGRWCSGTTTFSATR